MVSSAGHLLHDDEAQAVRADAVFDAAETVLKTVVVLVETVWTLAVRGGLGAARGESVCHDRWLVAGRMAAREGKPVSMHEELMRKFGIGRKEMPTLVLVGQADNAARLEPRGLWIIGGNGRIDLKRDGRRYLIVDVAKNFEAPDWRAAPAERRCDREAVNENWLRRVLR